MTINEFFHEVLNYCCWIHVLTETVYKVLQVLQLINDRTVSLRKVCQQQKDGDLFLSHRLHPTCLFTREQRNLTGRK